MEPKSLTLSVSLVKKIQGLMRSEYEIPDLGDESDNEKRNKYKLELLLELEKIMRLNSIKTNPFL
jgi:hypothetical protein